MGTTVLSSGFYEQQGGVLGAALGVGECYCHLVMEAYAGALSTDRGRCFCFVDDGHGRVRPCPRPVVASGRLQVGPTWVEVDACHHHSAQLRSLRRLELGPSSRYRSN